MTPPRRVTMQSNHKPPASLAFSRGDSSLKCWVSSDMLNCRSSRFVPHVRTACGSGRALGQNHIAVSEKKVGPPATAGGSDSGHGKFGSLQLEVASSAFALLVGPHHSRTRSFPEIDTTRPSQRIHRGNQ